MSAPTQHPMHPANSAARVIAAPFDVHATGRNGFIVQPATGGRAHRLDSARLQLLQICDALASMQEHAWNAARRLQHPNPAMLASILNELRQIGLLVDEALILRQACEATSHAIAPLESLFIRSSGRPRMLARALHSLAPFAHNLKRCVILDDTGNQSDRAAIDQVVEQLRPQLNCTLIHFRRERRSALVQHLAHAADTDPERLRWFVDAPSERKDSYGCGINLALLLSAGQRFLLLDDDATLDAFDTGTASPPTLSTYHALTGRALESEVLAAKPVALNPIEAHEQVLGRTAGEIAGPPQSIEQASPEMLLWLAHAGRIRFTSNGVYGDSGIRLPHWLYYQSSDAPVSWQDADMYQQSLRRETNIRREPGPRIITSYSTMTTTLTGIDNSEPLAPTLPFSVGEDTTLGELVRYTDPGSLLHAAPWMLEHRPETPRYWTREDAKVPMRHNLGTFFKQLLVNDAWCRTSRSSAARMQSLAALMNDIANAEQSDLEHELLRQTLESRAGWCQTLESKREQWSSIRYIVEDIDRMLESNRGEHWHPNDDPEADLTSIRRLAEGYAAGLNDWLEAWQIARQTPSDELLG